MEETKIFTLKNQSGMTMKVSALGGIVRELTVPDRNGEMTDVLLGPPRVEEHHATGYMSALIGRVGNRIGEGRFQLDGKTYQIPLNNKFCTLHGGNVGFDQKVWNARPFESPEGPAIELTCWSADGEEGFPGNLAVRVVYTLLHQNAWRIQYWAITDAPTVVNLTQHAYFNLNGGKSNILDHVLQMDCDAITEVNEQLIPTGNLVPVAGTDLDFSEPHVIGSRLPSKQPFIAACGGYDFNYMIRRKHPGLQRCAVLEDPASGRRMETWTTEPCVQLYTSNFVKAGTSGKNGLTYGPQWGVCFETQHAPDAPNHPNFQSIRLDPGMVYQSTTIYQFSTF